MTVTYNHYLKKYSRKLRKEGTMSDIMMWSILKKKQIKGYRFTRQKPIGNYIVDFYCGKLHLAIEIDGITHVDKETKDTFRQKEIELQKISFLRFYDEDVHNNLDGVFKTILNWVNEFEKLNGINNDIPVNMEW